MYVQDCAVHLVAPPRRLREGCRLSGAPPSRPEPVPPPARRLSETSCTLRDTFFGHPESVYTATPETLAHRAQVPGPPAARSLGPASNMLAIRDRPCFVASSRNRPGIQFVASRSKVIKMIHPFLARQRVHRRVGRGGPHSVWRGAEGPAGRSPMQPDLTQGASREGPASPSTIAKPLRLRRPPGEGAENEHLARKTRLPELRLRGAPRGSVRSDVRVAGAGVYPPRVSGKLISPLNAFGGDFLHPRGEKSPRKRALLAYAGNSSATNDIQKRGRHHRVVVHGPNVSY